MAQPELASTNYVAMFAASEPLATRVLLGVCKQGHNLFSGPEQVVGLLPVPCVVRPQPHPTPVPVQNFPSLPCNLRGVITDLGLQEGHKSLPMAMQ